jgi:hypothetical protein
MGRQAQLQDVYRNLVLLGRCDFSKVSLEPQGKVVGPPRNGKVGG